MRHLARFGTPCSSYLVGGSFPTMYLFFWYSDLLKVFRIGRFYRLSYSSSHELFQMCLSFRSIMSVLGSTRVLSLWRWSANTCQATDFWKFDWYFLFCIIWKNGSPLARREELITGRISWWSLEKGVEAYVCICHA